MFSIIPFTSPSRTAPATTQSGPSFATSWATLNSNQYMNKPHNLDVVSCHSGDSSFSFILPIISPPISWTLLSSTIVNSISTKPSIKSKNVSIASSQWKLSKKNTIASITFWPTSPQSIGSKTVLKPSSNPFKKFTIVPKFCSHLNLLKNPCMKLTISCAISSKCILSTNVFRALNIP